MPRSRRDDHFHKAHELCPKRAGAGIVISRQGDTVTVVMSNEELSGVIPLTSMPPVNAIVEVESRCELLVILNWTSDDTWLTLGDWYFTPSESPDWIEHKSDSQLGVGERVINPAPDSGGYLWNRTDFDVRRGDSLTFLMQVSKMDPDALIGGVVQLVFNWDLHGSDPQPETGEVVTYGDPVTIDGELVEFAGTAVVPDDFTDSGGDSHTPGRARLGLLYTAPGGVPTTVHEIIQTTKQYGGLTYDPIGTLTGNGFLEPWEADTAQTILGDGDDATGVAGSIGVQDYPPNNTNVIQDFYCEPYNQVNFSAPCTAATGVTMHVRYFMDSPDGGALDGRDGVLMAYNEIVGAYDVYHLEEATIPTSKSFALTDEQVMRFLVGTTVVSMEAQDVFPPVYETPGWRTLKVLELNFTGDFTITPLGGGGADALMQGEALTQTIADSSSSSFARSAAVPAGPPTRQQRTVTGDWVQRYDGEGAQSAAGGVGQGVVERDSTGDPLADGAGHERSLVGFSLYLPDDAVVTQVRLKVPWTDWWYANGVGDLVLGWHDQPFAPTEWTVGAGAVQLSTHDAREELLELNLDWAREAIESGNFGGLVIGPGMNDGPLYAGSTTAEPWQWELEVTFIG